MVILKKLFLRLDLMIYQAPLENLLVSTKTAVASHQYTFQLNAGHFIATAEPSESGGSDHSMDHGSSHGEGSHHGGSMPMDSRVTQLCIGAQFSC